MGTKLRSPTMDELTERLATYREGGGRGYSELMEIYRRVASGEKAVTELTPQVGQLAGQIAFIVMRELTLPPE